MSWPLVKIGENVEKVNTWNPTQSLIDEEFSYIDLSSIDKDEKVISLNDVQLVTSETAPSRARQLVKKDDVLVATVRPNLNGVAVVPDSLEGATASTGYCVLRANDLTLDSKYLYYWVRTNTFIDEMMKNAIGANYPAVSDKIIKDSKIPLPPLAEQKRIAAILDKADAIRRKRQQAIKLADDFLRSVFLDMFGDPVSNPKGWSIDYLSNLGTFKNGLNYGKDEDGTNISCLGVGDFKSLDRIEGVATLSNIKLNTAPAEDYLLKDGDLVFVRSNGNKALVGRCIAVYPRDVPLTFSGFCIRFRISDEKISTDYLNYLFRMPSVKHEMLKGGQGANIQNINQKTLSEIIIPIPPQNLLNKFSQIIKVFKSIETKSHINSDKILNLLSSVSQRAFSGQL